MAVRRMKRLGYRILEQNYRNSLGEIDIIAKDRDTLVFVEVKTRSSLRFGSPKRAVTPQKQRKISMVALAYLKQTGQMDVKARFDVVSVSTENRRPEIEIVKNAFDIAYP